MKTIKVGDKVYAKTAQFGNRSLRIVTKNRKAYNRKSKYGCDFNSN